VAVLFGFGLVGWLVCWCCWWLRLVLAVVVVWVCFCGWLVVGGLVGGCGGGWLWSVVVGVVPAVCLSRRSCERTPCWCIVCEKKAPNPINLYGLVISMAPNPINLYGLVTSMAPNRINLYGLVTSMAPNLINFTWFGDIHGPKTYKFIWSGDIHGHKPYKFIWFGDIHVTSMAPNPINL